MNDQERGLYGKYRVSRIEDPTGKHKDCEYYVLDLVHDKYAMAALAAYAGACRQEFPLLSFDLSFIVDDMRRRGWRYPTLANTLPMGGPGE